MQHGDLKIFIMTHQHTEQEILSPKKKRGTFTEPLNSRNPTTWCAED